MTDAVFNTQMPRPSLSTAAVTRQLFERYLDVIDRASVDPFATDPRHSLENLAWMCNEAIKRAGELPLDKLSRWLGFVQGCLAMRGLIDVDSERNLSRPLFHSAYDSSGIGRPPRLARQALLDAGSLHEP